jgi:GTPase SAR1 family protein
MDTQSHPHTPKIQFRVLIIGRANAGKTTILQRVCETTESPIIYRGKEQVRHGPIFFSASLITLPDKVTFELSMKVSDSGTYLSYACP